MVTELTTSKLLGVLTEVGKSTKLGIPYRNCLSLSLLRSLPHLTMRALLFQQDVGLRLNCMSSISVLNPSAACRYATVGEQAASLYQHDARID